MSAMVCLDLGDELVRRGGGALGHRLRGGQELVVGDAAPHQADALGLGAVEHLAEQDGGGDGLRAGDAAEHPRVPAAGVQAELQEPGVEPGRGGRPGGRRRRGPGSCRRPTAAPLTAAIGGQRRAADPQEALVDRPEARLGARRRPDEDRCERSAPAQKAAPVAGDHDRPDGRIGLELVEGVDDLGDHREGEGVAAVGVGRG